MIQRIQSIYLTIAAIVVSMVAFFNVGTFIEGDRQYICSLWYIKKAVPQGTYVTPVFYLGLMAIAIAVLSLIALFLYKKRVKQMKICQLLLILNLIWIFLLLYVVPEYTIATEVTFNPWIALALAPIILTWFAYKAIRKDEEKVRAADRLR